MPENNERSFINNGIININAIFNEVIDKHIYDIFYQEKFDDYNMGKEEPNSRDFRNLRIILDDRYPTKLKAGWRQDLSKYRSILLPDTDVYLEKEGTTTQQFPILRFFIGFYKGNRCLFGV